MFLCEIPDPEESSPALAGAGPSERDIHITEPSGQKPERAIVLLRREKKKLTRRALTL
jgi:hypothetical protein